MPHRLAADRDNARQAWAYALANGQAAELAEMARGMSAFSFSQGVRPSHLFLEAMERLRQRGLDDAHPAQLQLQLVELGARTSIEAYARLRQALLTFLPRLDEAGSSRQRYWGRVLLQILDSGANIERALPWAQTALQIAEETGDPQLVRPAEAALLLLRAGNAPLKAGPRARLETLLAELQPSFPESVLVFQLQSALSAHFASVGNAQTALRYGQRSLAIARGWRDLYWISQAADGLASIYVQLAMPTEARRQQLDALDWHLTIGQEWQTLGYLVSLALDRPELWGGDDEVVALLSMVYHHPDVVAYHAQVIEEARPALKERMGSAAYAAAWARGKKLGFAAGVALGRARLAATG